MIIFLGYNIGGFEVEVVIDEYFDVVELVVVGQFDEQWGFIVIVFVVLKLEVVVDVGMVM